MLTRQLDPGSDRAVFRQIADHLRELVECGSIPPGERLPSEAQLMTHYGVTRMTVRHALDQLKAEGLVYAEHGRGVFVRRHTPVRRLASDRFLRKHRLGGKAAFVVEAEQRGSAPTVDQIEITEEVPSPEVAARLGAGGASTIIRKRRYLMDGRPVEVATSYLPADIARGTPIADPNPGPGGIYARLEELGHRLDHFDEEIRARMPSQDEQRALLLTPGVPVLHLIRTAFATDGRAVEVCDTVMSSEAYVLDYALAAN